MLDAVNVSFGFRGERVLEDLSLSVNRGEVVAVIGPSGVGKTTLLRVLALSRRPDGGTVRIDGVDAWAKDEGTRLAIRRRIGMVFQVASLFDASVGRNVEYGVRIRRPWGDRVRDLLPTAGRSNGTPPAVRDALERVGMAGALGQPASSLSGGEAQRVAFARAVAYEPDLLLLDEPTSDLDPRNTAVIERAVSDARERGMAVVVATHDMHQARRVADRVAVLLDGAFTEVGPTSTVFGDPSDERTRRFITGKLVY